MLAPGLCPLPAALLLFGSTLLSGVVVDEEGRPLAGVVVRALTVASDRPSPAARGASGTSDARGRFWLGPLPPGDACLLRAGRPRYAVARARVAARAPLAARLGVRLVLRAQAAAFGRVLDDAGRPLPGAVVVLLPGASGAADPPPPTATDEDGRFVIPRAGPGLWDLAAQAEGFAPGLVRGLAIAQGHAPSDLGPVVLHPGGTLAGIVVDPAGEPVAGAEVRALPAGPTAAVRAASGALPGDRTDGKGRFRLENLEPGATFLLGVEHPGYAPIRGRPVATSNLAPLRLVLAPAARCAGRVVDDAGGPIPGALVVLLRAEPGLGVVLTATGDPEESARTDEEGHFAIATARPGRVRLLASAVGYPSSAERELELPTGRAATAAEVVLPRGATLSGWVTGDDGRPLAGAWVRVVERTGGPSYPAGAPPSALSDETGRYRLEGVPTGPRTIAAGDPAHRATLAELVVVAGNNDLDLRLASGGAPPGDGGARPANGRR